MKHPYSQAKEVSAPMLLPRFGLGLQEVPFGTGPLKQGSCPLFYREIDLNRFGTHALAFPLAHLKPQYRTVYMACVRRATRRGKAEVYPIRLWDRLPVVKIPLRPIDTDVPLDLQALVEQCYRNGAYEGTLNYAVDPDPPLIGAEADWAEAFLTEKGLRPRKKPPRRKGKPKSR
jgi:hypothetical protein